MAHARLVNLAEEAARFTSFEACVAAIPPLSALTHDALEELGLASLARDTCRIVEAVHARSRVPCAAIALDALAARCAVAAAVVRSEPELCPAVDPHDATRGRDALCLALAARRTQPCDALEASDSIACRATAHQDRALCKESPTTARRQACLRSVERWRGLVGPVSEVREHALRATLERADGAREFDALAQVGAVVVERTGKRRVAIEAARGRVRLRLRVRVSGDGSAELEAFELTEAGLVLARSGSSARVTATFDEGDAGMPGAVTITVRPGGEAEGFTAFVVTTPVRDRLAGAP